MPLNLSTALNGGDLSEDVPQVRIVRQMHDSLRGMIRLIFQYGKTDAEGKWVPLPTPQGSPSGLNLEGQAYIDFVTANAVTYEAVKAALYQKLLDDGLVPAGSVV